MVSQLSLYAFAGVLTLFAAMAARLRSAAPNDALADGRAALTAAAAALVAASALFAASGPLAAAPLWHEAGSAALLVSPFAASFALRGSARRRGNHRSMPRALVASALALGGVLLWLTLNLRGPRGGWGLVDIFTTLPAAAVAIAAAACLGWWSKRARLDGPTGPAEP